jgi:hypothetical protein
VYVIQVNIKLPQIIGYKKPIELKYNNLVLSIFSFIMFIVSFLSFNLYRIWIEKEVFENSFSGSINIFEIFLVMVVFCSQLFFTNLYTEFFLRF